MLILYSGGSRPSDKGFRGGGGWGEAVFKNLFWPFGPQFRLKISRGGGAGLTGPSLDPPLLHRIAFAPPRKSYGIGLLLTQKNGCGVAKKLRGADL